MQIKSWPTVLINNVLTCEDDSCFIPLLPKLCQGATCLRMCPPHSARLLLFHFLDAPLTFPATSSRTLSLHSIISRLTAVYRSRPLPKSCQAFV